MWPIDKKWSLGLILQHDTDCIIQSLGDFKNVVFRFRPGIQEEPNVKKNLKTY